MGKQDYKAQKVKIKEDRVTKNGRYIVHLHGALRIMFNSPRVVSAAAVKLILGGP